MRIVAAGFHVAEIDPEQILSRRDHGIFEDEWVRAFNEVEPAWIIKRTFVAADQHHDLFRRLAKVSLATPTGGRKAAKPQRISLQESVSSHGAAAPNFNDA